jgi:hypothetical protein
MLREEIFMLPLDLIYKHLLFMKKYLILFILLFFAFGIYSSPVGKGKALLFAKNFYYVNSVSDVSKESLTSEFVTEKSYKNTLCFYIVKFAKKGYVIVSADDAFFPVIGFSEEDNFSLDSMPPEMAWWLEMRAKEMIASNKFNTSSDATIQKVWDSFENANALSKAPKTTEVLPLLTSKWDQGLNYNFHCPEAYGGPGGKSYAGCVATAMSQIMYYYKYPQHGQSSHSYYDPYYVSVSADFANTTYDWASMSNSINTNSKEAISTLMFQCGVAVDMRYSPTGSSAYSEFVKDAMTTYFNYSIRSKYLEKDPYSNADWDQLLMDNLDNAQPLLYSGSGAEGGHAFVCDGYKDSCFFHFNWGWSGSGNGYFYTSSLNSGNGDFSSYQSALFNIAPYDYPYCHNQKTHTKNASSIGDGSGYSYYWNNSDCDWLIAPENSNKIVLQFVSFDTESGHDIVTIYDGTDATAPILGQFSGSNIPPTITSSGNAVYITFITDSANQHQGWQLNYSSLTTGIEETAGQNVFSVFPNPAENILNVQLTQALQEDATIEFYNLLGEKIRTEMLSKNKSTKNINLSDVPEGVYFIMLKTKNTTNITKLIVSK